MDIDKLIRIQRPFLHPYGFGSLMDIDKLIPGIRMQKKVISFGSLMDIDKLIHKKGEPFQFIVLVL